MGGSFIDTFFLMACKLCAYESCVFSSHEHQNPTMTDVLLRLSDCEFVVASLALVSATAIEIAQY